MPAKAVAIATPISTARSTAVKPLTGPPPPRSTAGHHGVVVRVRRRTAAQQHERIGSCVPELVWLPGRDYHAVPGHDLALVVAEAHPPRAGDEVVQLLGPRVVMLGGLTTCGDRGLGQALVASRGP